MLSRKEENRKKRKRNKALRARIACAFSATNPSLLVTHNKNSTDKGRALRSFAPYGARHFVPE